MAGGREEYAGVTADWMNYEFFNGLMESNDFLVGICHFAESLIAVQGVDLPRDERDRLALLVECSQLKIKVKKQRKKKKQDEKLEVTEQEIERRADEELLRYLEELMVPKNRLTCEFAEDELAMFTQRIKFQSDT